MARNYPRFLFSDPKNTKSEGPFIVHTLEPRFILKFVIYKTGKTGTFEFILLKNWSELPDNMLKKEIEAANTWFTHQVLIGEINTEECLPFNRDGK